MIKTTLHVLLWTLPPPYALFHSAQLADDSRNQA